MPSSATYRWTLGILLVGTVSLGAQVTGTAGMGAMLQRESAGLWRSTARFEPALRMDNPWVQLAGDAGYVVGSRGSRLERGNASLLAETPAWSGFRVSGTMLYERLDVQRGFAGTHADGELALSYARGRSGAWLGLGSERSFASLGYDGDALVRAGLWRQVGPMTVALSSRQHSSRENQYVPVRVPGLPQPADTLRGPPADTGHWELQSVKRVRRWSDMEARVSWVLGRAVIDGQFGMQQAADSIPSMMWGRATATVALASRLSLVGSFGTRPSREWMGATGSRFATLGVRIAPATLARPAAPAHVQPAAAAFAVRAAETGMMTIAVRVPAARTVELSGDFNQWKPVALREVSPDVWEATLALAPGSYHVNLRVNGASWEAPPGLASVTDEFNGRVGILIVR